LALPYGLGSGFTELWLPFALTRAGYPVALTGSIVAIGISANVYRFLYAPAVDLTLTVRSWYLIGLSSCVITTLMLGVMPLTPDHALLVTAVVFLCEVGTTLVMNPVGALMATTVDESLKGRAGGWCQAGNFGGKGLAGATIWLSVHYSNPAAAIVVASVMSACVFGLLVVAQPAKRLAASWKSRLQELRSGLLEIVRDPESRLIMIFFLSPISVGAATAIWPALGPEWAASPDRVALDNGFLGAVVATIGAVVGGQVADRVTRWWSYLGAGGLLVLLGTAVALLERTPATYDLGVLGYQFLAGMGTAAWCALCLYATGRTAVATKYAALASLGNLPNSYMTAVDGWVHDQFGVSAMLLTEAAAALACIALALLALRRIGSSTDMQGAAMQPARE
jgi:hypothetical protein